MVLTMYIEKLVLVLVIYANVVMGNTKLHMATNGSTNKGEKNGVRT